MVARGIDRSYGDRRILTGVDITVAPGSRTGLIGENGVGKSTLRILAGVEEPDNGAVERPARTGILWQAAADALDTPASRTRYERALDAAERAEVWTLDARREEILGASGISMRAFGATRPARIGELSGGQRSRVALAGLLLSRPDALLLDEPTNHLGVGGRPGVAATRVPRSRGWPKISPARVSRRDCLRRRRSLPRRGARPSTSDSGNVEVRSFGGSRSCAVLPLPHVTT